MGTSAARISKAAPLQSVEQALRVLEALADQDELGVSELAAMLGRSPSGAFRLLSTLRDSGYVEQVPATRKYQLGLKVFELSAKRARHLDLRAIARPFLLALVRSTGETARLDVLDRFESISVDTIEGTHAIQPRTWVGYRSACYATATGKAQLAFQPADFVDAVIAARLVAFTAHTITDPVALRQEIARIRQQGYATNVSGWREGASGVAAPIYNADGSVIAALGLAGPNARMKTAKELHRLAQPVMEAATQISRQLGWVPLVYEVTNRQR